jgi:hypothetical protein
MPKLYQRLLSAPIRIVPILRFSRLQRLTPELTSPVLVMECVY